MRNILLVLLTLLFSISLQSQVLYVKADAIGANNGTTWSSAYTDLQDAIAAANYGTQIWVAVGTYKPTSGTDRDAYFELENGVEIYGGFIGTEAQLAERDYIHNESILSGDIGVVGDSLDNSYTIVYSFGTDENTILEGFTIRDGNANRPSDEIFTVNKNRSGGGVYLSGEDGDLRCQIKHCHFFNNYADYNGGGLAVSIGEISGSVRPVIFANQFTQNNTGGIGGGFYWGGGTYLQGELIVGDSLSFDRNIGGGLSVNSRENSAKTKILNCSFNENSGGAFFFIESSYDNIGLVIENSDFEYNTGGGISLQSIYDQTDLTIKDCYFDHNAGGAVIIEGHIVEANTSPVILIENSTFLWNTGSSGGGINIAAEGAITTEIKKCIFQYNSANFSGGAIYSTSFFPGHKFRVTDCYFEGNAANGATGGGIHVQTNDTKITNSIFKANIGKTGAGIRMINGEVTNCVFYENNALQQGGGIRCQQPTIANCIFWNNVNFGIGPDIYNNSFPITLQSCLFSEASCDDINYNNSNINCGTNSLFGIDPQFTDADAGDFSTATNSIVRDAGDSSFFPTGITEDFYGNSRIEGSSIDLGVYEIPAVSINAITIGTGDCQEESLNNGTLNYDIVNGVAPLTLSVGEVEITTSEIAGTMEGLAGGTYDFTVIDAIGNSSTQPVSIPFLPQPITSTEITSPTCNGYTNGVISLSATGETAPFSILWDNGTTNFGQFGVGGGNYSYTLTDVFGCQSTDTETIPQPNPITINGTVQNTLCGNNSTGQISINPTGGTGNLTAAWSPNPNNENGYELTNIASGVYSVTVTDASGCASASQFTVTDDGSIEISAEITDAGCSGSASGAITITPANLNYTWSNNQTGATISDLIAADYTVTATDANGCTTTQTYTVSAGAPLTFSPTLTGVSCAGETNGSINLNIENPEGLNFAWSPNANGQTGISLSGLSADTYSLTVTDGDDCQSFAEYIIEEPTELSISSVLTNPSCLNGSDGEINLTAQGGTGDYSYEILPILTEDANGIFSGAAAGMYQISVTDDNNCTLTNEIVLENGVPLIVTGDVSDALCFEGNTGAITVNGTAGSTYVWSANAEGQTGNNITNLAVDTYAVTVTDSAGCEGSTEFTIGQATEILITNTTQNVSCFGGNDGRIELSTTGGTPFSNCAYVYTISPNLTTEDCGIFSGATAGMYEITAEDVNGCQSLISVEVIENAALTASPNVNNASCPGSTDGSVTFEITGGTAPYTTVGETENLGAGTYTATISDINDCTFEVIFEIAESAGLELTIVVTDASCPGSDDGSIELVINGGIPPYTIEGETENLTAGAYNISVADSNGCDATASFTINQPLPLNFDFDIVNAQSQTSEDGSISIENVTGGTSPYTFTWGDGTTMEDLINIPAGDYVLLINDANACSYNFGFEVDFNTAVSLTDLSWELRLQPNLISQKQNTHLLLKSDRNTDININIYNVVGQKRESITINVSQGTTDYILPTDNLSVGIYFVQLEVPGVGTEVLQLVIGAF